MWSIFPLPRFLTNTKALIFKWMTILPSYRIDGKEDTGKKPPIVIHRRK